MANILSIIGLGLTWLIAATQYFFILIATFDEKGTIGLYKKKVFPSQDVISTGVTGPLAYIAAGWGIALIFQLAWQIYMSTTLCRRGSEDIAVYELAPYNPAFYIVFLLAAATSVVRLFFPGIISLVLLGVFGLLMSVCLVIAVRHTFAYHDVLTHHGILREYIWETLFVHNGIAAMASWGILLTHAHLSSWMLPTLHLSLEQTSFYGLTILLVVYVVFVTIDQGLYERETRFIYTPYFMIVLMLVPALLVTKMNTYQTNAILSIGLLTLVGFNFVMKVIIGTVRESKSPTFPPYKNVDY